MAKGSEFVASTPSRRRLPIIGVMGSGSDVIESIAAEVGGWLASLPVHLLTGGGGGMMEAVSRAFHSVPNRQGLVLGILPGGIEEDKYLPKDGYPNRWVEIPIRTHLPLSGSSGTEFASRNHINALTADVIVALSGSHGTASEVRLAIRYKKPVIVYLPDGLTIPGLPAAATITKDFNELKDFVESLLSTLELD